MACGSYSLTWKLKLISLFETVLECFLSWKPIIIAQDGTLSLTNALKQRNTNTEILTVKCSMLLLFHGIFLDQFPGCKD